MTKMTTETMMQANGGKAKYRCTYCGAKLRNTFMTILHVVATGHRGFIKY